MSLRFSLSGAKVKHLKSAIQSLGKIGSELMIEAIPEKMIISSINSSQTAYMSVTFHCGFFDSYSVFAAAVPQAGVLVKSLLAVFRTQKIRSMDVELSSEDTSINFSLVCQNGLRKTYMVQCVEAEVLRASVDKDQYPVTVVAETGELNRLLSTFESSLDEIIIVCSPDTEVRAGKAVQLHSFLDPAKVNMDKALRTQLAIDTHHVFLAYSNQLGEATDVTFHIKDFKCMVQLCELMPANTMLRFDQPGQPLIVEPHLSDGAIEELQYEAELVLATLMESKASLLQQDAARLSTPSAADWAPLHGNAGTTPMRGNPAATPGGLSVPGDTPMVQKTPGNFTTPPKTHTTHSGFTPAPSRFATTGVAGGECGTGRDSGARQHADPSPVTDSREAGNGRGTPEQTPAGSLSGKGTFSFGGHVGRNGAVAEESPAFPLWKTSPLKGDAAHYEAVRQDGGGALAYSDPLFGDDEEEEDDDAIPSTPPDKRLKSSPFHGRHF